ncbi:hypothetical protein H920_03070 [Fukomys damarensis]|uniref:Uncharacterized protein n=1 Tax=Fukomys damarensis TaxID=885580 RepID=A0A091DYZ7_FUKDA|nr:hypothetical protein H920_03070 [Fukomys damarensis]
MREVTAVASQLSGLQSSLSPHGLRTAPFMAELRSRSCRTAGDGRGSKSRAQLTETSMPASWGRAGASQRGNPVTSTVCTQELATQAPTWLPPAAGRRVDA